MKAESHTQHLTDEQFGELLSGELPDGRTRVHLGACALCRSEVEAVRGSVETFNGLSLRWAQAEAPRRVPVPSGLALRLGGRPLWSLGLAASAAGVLVGVGMSMPFGQPHQAAPTQARITVPTHAELAEDNRLMQSIDQELRYDVQPVVPAPELRSAGTATMQDPTKTVTN